MRRDGRRVERRPRGAVLRPLALLVAAALTGFGVWHLLVRDDPGPRRDGEQITRHDPQVLDDFLAGTAH